MRNLFSILSLAFLITDTMAENIQEVTGILSTFAIGQNSITAAFATAKGDTHIYKATFASTTTVDSFTSGNATLAYSNETVLADNCAITGFINRDDFDFLMCKGARITGGIQKAGVARGSEILVHGFGTWSSSIKSN